MSNKRSEFYNEVGTRGSRGSKEQDTGEGLPLEIRKEIYDGLMERPVPNGTLVKAFSYLRPVKPRELMLVQEAFRNTFRTYPNNKKDYINSLKQELKDTAGIQDEGLIDVILSYTHPWYQEQMLTKLANRAAVDIVKSWL